MPITPQEALQRVIVHREIFFDEMVDLMRQIMRGDVSPALTAALLTGLRVKKETVGEIAGAASAMREFAARVEVADSQHFVDIVGTGGDNAHTFNISTAAMFVAAAAGAKVAKHGNRSVSSSSGSADVLEALGAAIELTAPQVAQCLAETGFAFMFAPIHHPAMKNVAAVRKELGVRTIFNILGPLTNPAGAPNMLMGVFHPDLVGIQARVLHRLGARHALVVHGGDGLDEITLAESTLVAELRDGQVREYELHPRDVGLKVTGLGSLRVDSPDQSRDLVLEALDGRPGPARDIVLFNAGAALYAADVAVSVAEGVERARGRVERRRRREAGAVHRRHPAPGRSRQQRGDVGMSGHSFALTPEPPYYAVIFSSLRQGPDDGYNDMAERMVTLAAEQPGFLGVESVRGADGFGITVSYWTCEEAIQAWKQNAEHSQARQRGRLAWYEHFEIRVARVERAYAGPRTAR